MQSSFFFLALTGLLRLGLAVPECVAGSGVCTAYGAPAAVSGSVLAKDAGDVDPALGLVQKALWYKTRELKTGEALANSTRSADVVRTVLANRIPCRPRHNDDGYVVPLNVRASSEMAVFRELGFLNGWCAGAHARDHRHAAGPAAQSLLATMMMPNSTIEEKNQVARLVALAWFMLIASIVIWSLFSVLAVPRKREWENSMTQRKLNLANEEEAFKRGFFHWISLTWVDGLIGRYGKCLHAVVSDNEIVENRDDSNYTPYTTLRKHWREEVEAKGMENASLTSALYKTIGFKSLSMLMMSVIIELLFCMVGMVIALDRLMHYLEDIQEKYLAHPEQPQSLLEPTVVIVVLLFGVPMIYRSASVVVALLDGYYNNMCAAGLASLVFEKALSLPVGSSTDDGEEDPMNITGVPGSEEGKEKDAKPSVVQLLNIDIMEAWSGLLKTLACTIFAPFISLILFAMLIQQLKMAGAIGCLYILPCTIAMVFSQIAMIFWWRKYQGYQDKRLKSLTETLLHIRTIKSLAWESLSFKRLNDARQAELVCSQKTITLGGLCMSILHTSPWFSMLIALYANMIIHGGVQAHQIIVVQRLMMSLMDSLGIMQLGLRKFAQVPNSFRRLKTYLSQPDRPEGVVREPTLSVANSPAVRLQGSFTFVQGKPPVLHNLDIAIPRGELVAVIGNVASGKSALLQTVIGELYAAEGAHVEAPASGSARLAYCAQVPWIFEGTLRDNVILKSTFDEERYQKALYAAALMPDLQILPGGDQVTIGSHGVRLSGGQRARVALARAAYMQELEVVCVDDPFASVDVPAGQHLLDELLMGQLMQNRTRIVVTQPNPQRLRSFDRVILLRDGCVVVSGPPAEVMETKEFMSLLTSTEEENMAGPSVDSSGRSTPVTQRPKSASVRNPNAPPASSLRDVEAQEHVTWDAIRWWLQAAGYGNIAFFGCMCVVQRMLMLRENLALAMWIDAKGSGSDDAVDIQFICLTMAYVLACCVCIWFVAFAASRVSISAASKMHSTVVYAILRAPIDKFFDKQPVGRLINRLSFDMRQVDDYIPIASVALMMFFFGFCVTQSFIISVMPFKVVIASLPFYVACFIFAYLYRGTAVPLVFHQKFSLSQLQDLQTVVLTSCVSIRANGMFEDFMARYNHQSASIIRSVYLIHFVCKAWVQARIFLCLSTLTCVFAVGGLWSHMPMGILGTVVSLSFQQMVEFENISTVFTQFINILNALQRLTNYFKVPQEGEASMATDPTVRLRLKMDRAAVPRLQIKRGSEVEACLPDNVVEKNGKKVPLVVCLRNVPVLKVTSDGLGLEPVEGAKLQDLFPSCAELREQGNASYRIIAVNSLTKDPERMAEELCNPPASVWLDLWHNQYAAGMRIQLEDLTAGYGNDKSVLENVRIDITAREKVGFAGKTGCGKSTTLLCILRILEPRGGRIVIGGLDTKKIGLNCLRSIVGLVPQDPTVFAGSWRYNIDPFNEFPDGRIWEALQSVQLLPYIRSLPGGIDSEITQDGGNISFGQRQLLSLARMVIRQPPVLLLDECTSALDPNTQQAAQNTLLNDFPMTTVIAIAHRVETILDFDRIVVFDKGSVAENGSVKNVMSIENGIFKRMVEGTKGTLSPLTDVKE